MSASNSIQPEMKILHAASIKLTGVSLIEASAGTGKTFTITSLYLRLVLGHGCEPMSPENILVVTFTRAATEELRSRIRSRLRQAYLTLNGQGSDPLIEEIKGQVVDIEKAKQQLKDAQQLMDLASIFTIHGFAQRLLRQNAVESGLNGEFELLLDESEILEQAVRDVWRTQVYPLTGISLQLVLDQWKTPDELLKNLRSLIYKQADFHLGNAVGDINLAHEALLVAQSLFADAWQEQGQEFVSEILNNPQANGTFAKNLPKKVDNIEAFLNKNKKVKTKDVAEALKALTKQGLIKSVKKAGTPVDHALSDLCERLLVALDTFEQAKTFASRSLRVEFLEAFKQRLQYLKQQQQLLSTDDLLSQVNHALNGQNQDILLQNIRQQYPVAMVDEFQDTDAQQYRVFNTLYSVALNEDKSQSPLGLFMIGDPKQAIYKFRGADIFTYIQAKKKVDSQFTLNTNYRSTKSMVNAVNQIFTQHSHPFIYDENIPFMQVEAKDSAKSLYVDDERQPAISWVVMEDKTIQTKSSLTQACAEQCAEQVSLLLNGATQGRTRLADKPLAASDMAILVRNRQQAAVIKHSLTLRGVSCVYVGQDSVFESEEAHALLALLQGVHGLSERQFRNAIAHPTWSLSLDDLQHLREDESAWEAQLEQLYVCHETWQKQGVMAMIMHWLHSRDLPKCWLAELEGERRLTNMMHLAELLQDSSTQVQGMQGLVSWFTQQIMQSLGDGEQKQLRLESDANLVQIVTIHKSKGLEYPVVFLPFNWDGKESKDELFFDETKQNIVCDLTDDYKAERIREGLAEEVRLLYVGLTRAASKCYVTIPEVTGKSIIDKSMSVSALQHVLFHQVEQDEPKLPLLKRLIERDEENKDSFEVQLPLTTMTEFHETHDRVDLQARKFAGKIKKDWQLSSFSSLVRHLHAPVSPRFDLDDDTSVKVSLSEEQVAQLDGQFRFPRGAHAGNFLHTLLEEIDFSDLADDLDRLIENLLARFGIDLYYADLVVPWLDNMLHAPMMQHGESKLTLADLTPNLKVVEMEFYFPVETLNARAFNRLLNEFPCVNVDTPQLDFMQLKGMLKGFIDLTFEWQGQYFILDYKSNHLGDDFESYNKLSMETAMAEHRYDVQLVIYTLALHRLLALRIPNYDYDVHMGGGYYLFLRGLTTENSDTGRFFSKPDKRLILSLDRLMKGENVETILDSLSSEPTQGSLL